MSWKVYEWTGTAKEIKYLRDNNYPKPEDCLDKQCPGCRPACQLGICFVAINLCGDF